MLRDVLSGVLPGMPLGVLLGVVALLPQRGQRVWAHNLMSGHSQREMADREVRC